MTAIPQSAIDAGSRSLIPVDIASHAEVAEVVLTAALPHLLADHRERLVKASAEIAAMADQQKDMGNSYFRLCGKQQGLDLALSYLDEMTR